MRKFLNIPLFFSVLVIVLGSCSSGSKTIKTTPVNASKKSVSIVMPKQHFQTPLSASFVEDNEQLFSSGEKGKLDTLLRNFEKSNLIAIKLITVADPTITTENFDSNNRAMLVHWSAAHANSEHCMTISISRNLRRMRIDFGTFVEKLLSDNEASFIIENNCKPSFKQELYYQGTVEGINAIMNTIRRNIKM